MWPPFLVHHCKDHWAGWGPQDFNSYYTELLCCLFFICFCTLSLGILFIFTLPSENDFKQPPKAHIYLRLKCVLKRWSISHSVWHATLHEPKRLETYCEVKLGSPKPLSPEFWCQQWQIMEPDSLQLNPGSELGSALPCHVILAKCPLHSRPVSSGWSKGY